MSKHRYTVYILRSLKDCNLYVGMTSNIVSRLKKHQAGGVPSTKHRRPLEIVYSEECPDRETARKREIYFKSGPGHQETKRILERRVPTSSG
ncbi:MAG: GIY-YIG nuclease family protein [Ignavibacteriales bacterium]|nr:GIY-YIG nuclease family protein [Ignavibacteriales bacterium]